MSDNKQKIINSIKERFNSYFNESYLCYHPTLTPEVFFQKLKEKGLHALNEEELKKFKNIANENITLVTDFILEEDDDNKVNVTIKELIRALPEKDIKTIVKRHSNLQDLLIATKLYENIDFKDTDEFRSSNSYSHFLELSKLENSYINFYKQLTLTELLYFYKDVSKLMLLDQVLFKLIIPKIHGRRYELTGEDAFTIIEKCFGLLEQYGEEMPVEWFIELNSENFEELFKPLLRNRFL